MEFNTARSPVNQRIVAGEPVISENSIARRIQGCHQKSDRGTFSRRKMYSDVASLIDYRSRRTIKKTQLDWRDRISTSIDPGYGFRIEETMSRTTVHNYRKLACRKMFVSDRNYKGIGMTKRGSAECYFTRPRTIVFNAVCLSCGFRKTALYFFESVSTEASLEAFAERALDEEAASFLPFPEGLSLACRHMDAK